LDKNHIRKEIEELIGNIKAHFDNALDHDHIPELELKTIVHKIEKLHQQAIVLHYLVAHNLTSHKSASAVNIESATDQESDKNNKEEPVQTDLFGEPILPKQAPASNRKTDSSALENAVRVEDIRELVGINEKFQFINELFEGILNEYNAAMNQLNNYPSYNDAEAYLNSVKAIYKWDDENPVVEKFFSIVRRKLK